MTNPLIINNTHSTTEEKVNALINIVNILTTQMYEGRVKQAQNDIQNGKEVNKQYRKELDTASITFVTLAEAGQIDDITAGENLDMFAEWIVPVAYKVGNLRKYNKKLYRCIADHISQADWTPDTAVSLWVLAADPTEEFPIWSQPIGAHDTYSIGNKVTHNNIKWVSIVDNNVWEPGVYGWEEYIEL